MALLNPYLSFLDNAREAMEFYQSVFGGELAVSTFGEFGQAEGEAADLVMHSQLEAPGGLVLMGADTPPSMEYHAPAGITISLSGADETELRGYWDGLAAGGSVSVPLETAPWGDTFGELVDRYGVSWMVNIAGAA